MSNLPAVVQLVENDPGFAFHELVPPGIEPRRVLAGFKMAVMGNPKLRTCSVDSLADAALDCARLGLWPGPHGHIYLVPYGRTCTPIVGYRGLIALARRHLGARVEARLVHAHDHFAVRMGTDPGLDHTPATGDRGDVVSAYAVAFYPDGSVQFDHMDVTEIHAIRDRSRGKDGPWSTDFGEMARKTVVRRLMKYVGIDETIGHAFDVMDKAEGIAPQNAHSERRKLSPPPRSPAAAAASYAGTPEPPAADPMAAPDELDHEQDRLL